MLQRAGPVGRVAAARGVLVKRRKTGCRVEVAFGVAKERLIASSSVRDASGIAKERGNASGRVVVAAGIAKKRINTSGCVERTGAVQQKRCCANSRILYSCARTLVSDIEQEGCCPDSGVEAAVCVFPKREAPQG